MELGTYFIILNKEGQPIGVDLSSGGYPFVARNPWEVTFWPTKDEATRYIDMMRRAPHTCPEAKDWTVFRFMFSHMWIH